jgi:hypothetical protein
VKVTPVAVEGGLAHDPLVNVKPSVPSTVIRGWDPGLQLLKTQLMELPTQAGMVGQVAAQALGRMESLSDAKKVGLLRKSNARLPSEVPAAPEAAEAATSEVEPSLLFPLPQPEASNSSPETTTEIKP